MSARGVLLIGIVLAIFSSVSCCDLNNTTSITLCVTKFMEDGRDAVKSEIEPWHMKTVEGTVSGSELKWRVENPVMMGLGNFIYKDLRVFVDPDGPGQGIGEFGRPKGSGDISVTVDITWPSLIVRATGKFRLCRKFRMGIRCHWLTSSLTFSVVNPIAAYAILLQRKTGNYELKGEFFDRSGPGLQNVSVRIDFNGLNEKIATALKLPLETVRNELSTNYWNKGRSDSGKNGRVRTVAFKFLDHIRKITTSYLPSQLDSRLPIEPLAEPA